ncbi:hypothetical protein H311_02597 [Anncaliia algerae PRA109]|nr:hypothetical protein H311_02597 [Anncaliia algerae PRA109]
MRNHNNINFFCGKKSDMIIVGDKIDLTQNLQYLIFIFLCFILLNHQKLVLPIINLNKRRLIHNCKKPCIYIRKKFAKIYFVDQFRLNNYFLSLGFLTKVLILVLL